MKKIHVLIITLVIILVLGCVTFAALYFATDIFKTDKEMFYKYIGQINLDSFTNSVENEKYQDRLKAEKYKNEGSVTIKSIIGEQEDINEKFNYVSQVDSSNKLASSVINISRDGEELVTIDYLRNEDVYGLKFEDIISQYISLENNNLKEFASKLGIQDSTMPDKIELPDSTEIASKEELKQIFDKYIKNVIDQIPETSYAKVAKADIQLGENTIQADGYSLKIDLKTLQKITIEILNQLKGDEQVFNLISSIMQNAELEQEITLKQYQQALDEMINGISKEAEENFNVIDVIVYKKGKDLVKTYVKITLEQEGQQENYIDFSIENTDDKSFIKINIVSKQYYNQTINLTISKNKDLTENEECKIVMLMNTDGEENINANIITRRQGKLSSNSIQNTMEASIIVPEQSLQLSAEYKNNKTFDSNINIEKFNEENHAVINEFSGEQINNLMSNLSKLISDKTQLNVVDVIGAAGIGILSTSQQNVRKYSFNRRYIGWY